jgi:methylglutaconyl-CoA hydratase
MSEFKYILVDVADRVGTITLNRPDKRNALNYVVIQELKTAFTQLQADANVKVIVLKSTGNIFCSGADLEYLQKLQSYGFNENLADSTHLMELYLLVHKLSKVVIAQIEGHAIAGGCGLATVCDYAYAVPEAKFGYTEVKIGFIPAIVMVFLIRKIGEGRAREMLLTGDLIDAERAARYGILNDVIGKDKIAERVQTLAQKLCTENSGGSLELTKRMIADVQNLPLEDALKFAARMNAHARETMECKRGIAAFLNKEKLAW